MNFADPHETLWLQDEPVWARAHDVLTPQQQLDRSIAGMRSVGYRIVVKRRARGLPPPRTPSLHDVWFARRKGKTILSGHITARLLAGLLRDQERLCGYCRRPVRTTHDPNDGRLLADLDHRVAQSRGGTWKRKNMIGACRSCNSAKADLPEVTYREILARFPPEPSGHFMQRVRIRAQKHVTKLRKAKKARP